MKFFIQVVAAGVVVGVISIVLALGIVELIDTITPHLLFLFINEV